MCRIFVLLVCGLVMVACDSVEKPKKTQTQTSNMTFPGFVQHSANYELSNVVGQPFHSGHAHSDNYSADFTPFVE